MKDFRKLKERLVEVEANISLLNLKQYQQSVLKTGYVQPIREMNWLAIRNLYLQNFTNVSLILLSAVLPVVIYFDMPSGGEPAAGAEWRSVKFFALVLSVLIAVINAIRQSYKFREKWQNYFKTIELLLIEGERFFALAGSYRQFAIHADAFQTFIANIGVIKLDEVNNFLKTSNTDTEAIIENTITQQLAQRQQPIAGAAVDLFKVQLIENEINDFVKRSPAVTYYDVDHERKLITLHTNTKAFVLNTDKMAFSNSALTDLSYKMIVGEERRLVTQNLRPSSAVRNKDTADDVFGSAGCFCTRSDGKTVFLTCYHVVKHPAQSWSQFDPAKKHADVVSSSGRLVGRITDAEKTDELDIALIEIISGDNPDFLIAGERTLIAPALVNAQNFRDYNPVFIYSRKRSFKKIQGKLAAVNRPATIAYEDGDKDLDKLFLIKSISTEPFSLEGDSGSVVFTADGLAVGIVVAGDNDTVSFAMPFTAIQNRFNLKLINT